MPSCLDLDFAVQKKLEAVGSKPEIEDKAAKLEGVDFFGKQEITKYAKMISMTDQQWREMGLLKPEFIEFIMGLLRSSPPASKAKQFSGLYEGPCLNIGSSPILLQQTPPSRFL